MAGSITFSHISWCKRNTFQSEFSLNEVSSFSLDVGKNLFVRFMSSKDKVVINFIHVNKVRILQYVIIKHLFVIFCYILFVIG